MIHRAICGSMERFLGILIEHHAGHFPLWLAPVQVMVTTITSEGDEYAVKVRDDLRKAGLRAEADLRNEKINYKVREHSLAKVPVILVESTDTQAGKPACSARDSASLMRNWVRDFSRTEMMSPGLICIDGMLAPRPLTSIDL